MFSADGVRRPAADSGMGVTFEIVPVVPSAQTREVVALRLAAGEEGK